MEVVVRTVAGFGRRGQLTGLSHAAGLHVEILVELQTEVRSISFGSLMRVQDEVVKEMLMTCSLMIITFTWQWCAACTARSGIDSYVHSMNREPSAPVNHTFSADKRLRSIELTQISILSRIAEL